MATKKCFNIAEFLKDETIRAKYELPKEKVQTLDVNIIDPGWREHARSTFWWESSNIQNPYYFLRDMIPDNIEIDSKEGRQYIKKYCMRHAEFLVLHQLLLKIGGTETCFPGICEDIRKILSRGHFYKGSSKMMKGRPSQCHSNSAELWYLNHENHNINICTGFALSKDGIWREHTWLVHRYFTEHQRRMRIIETTVKRLAYFGYELSDDEAYQFVDENP